MHNHGNDHSHINKNINEKKLFLTILLNIIITISEIIGGLISGSLALLSDAFHNLSDVFSLIISYIAVIISKKEKNDIKTFGYKRAEILAALFNIIILLGACCYIIYEGIKRFFMPHKINAPIMLIITIIGLLSNFASILILLKDAKKNINIKSAFLHLLGDTFSSVGVLIAALCIIFFPNLYFLDPIISIAIALYIIKESFSIFLESINILMQGKPKHLSIKKIKERLQLDKKLNIIDIHHIHIWSLSSDEIIMDCHIVLPENKVNKTNEVLKKINEILSCEFCINHSTIQVETPGYKHSKNCRI